MNESSADNFRETFLVMKHTSNDKNSQLQFKVFKTIKRLSSYSANM